MHASTRAKAARMILGFLFIHIPQMSGRARTAGTLTGRFPTARPVLGTEALNRTQCTRVGLFSKAESARTSRSRWPGATITVCSEAVGVFAGGCGVVRNGREDPSDHDHSLKAASDRGTSLRGRFR
jgi:hypothetical protein